MEIPFILQAIAALLVGYVVVGVIVNYMKLRQFDGPFWAGFSRIWIFWHSINGRLNKVQYEALEKYGPVCRLGPDLLMTNDVEILRHISAPRSKWRRSPWYDTFSLDPEISTVFSTRDESLHAELKSKEAGAYYGRGIDTLESDVDSRIVEFLNFIQTKYENKSADMSELIRWFVLDVLSTVAFGRPFGFMSANKDLWSFNKTSGEFLQVVELSMNHRFFQRIFASPIMSALAGPKPTDKTGMGPALAFAHRAVAERFGDGAKTKKDMLGHFVSKGLSQKQCEADSFVQILAGSDSTTAILRSGLFTLAANPAAYRKLQNELDAAVASGQLSLPSVKYAEAQNLPYLQACIWETFRMFPPLFGFKSKSAPPGGETINGIFFPEGVELGGLEESVCKRKDIFGEDADLFRPERWLEVDAETRVRYERTVDLIFGSGRYMCLGKHIATMEVNKCFAALLLHFEWSIAQPMAGVPTYAHGVYIQSDMNMIPRLRRPIAPLKTEQV